MRSRTRIRDLIGWTKDMQFILNWITCGGWTNWLRAIGGHARWDQEWRHKREEHQWYGDSGLRVQLGHIPYCHTGFYLKYKFPCFSSLETWGLDRMSNKWHPIGLNPARSQILNISTNSQKLNLAGACSEPYPKSNCGDDESQFLDLDSITKTCIT